jgi:hypothetical protein
MAKSGDTDVKELASDATQALGPLKKALDDAFKQAQLMTKSPNPKMAEKLADQVEEIISDAAALKTLLKDLQKASG